MKVEDAVENSRTGRALALYANGRHAGVASGPSFVVSERKRRKRKLSVAVTLYPGAAPLGGPNYIRLHEATAEQRAAIDKLDWQPEAPITVVDRIASIARRGRVSP